MAFQVFHTEAGLVARRCIHRIAVEEAGRSRKAAGVGEAVGSHILPVLGVGRNSEVESSSLAGAGTAVVVDLHILRGIQIQDSPTFLLVDVIEKKKQSTAGDCLVSARRQKALPNVEIESRCEAWNCLIQLWS